MVVSDVQCVLGGTTVSLHSFLPNSELEGFFVWVVCPSSRSNTFVSLLGCVVCIKCLSHLIKTSLVIQPFSVQANCVPGGAPVESSNLKRSLLNMSNGKRNIPAALMLYIHVVFVSLPALVSCPNLVFTLTG